MSQKIKIDSVERDFDSLSGDARAISEKLQQTDNQIQDTTNLYSLLNRAKKAISKNQHKK